MRCRRGQGLALLWFLVVCCSFIATINCWAFVRALGRTRSLRPSQGQGLALCGVRVLCRPSIATIKGWVHVRFLSRIRSVRPSQGQTLATLSPVLRCSFIAVMQGWARPHKDQLLCVEHTCALVAVCKRSQVWCVILIGMEGQGPVTQ